MKKLMMIAAAMTIAGGAFAQCGDPETPETNCALVYKVKMNLKTTVAKSTKGYYDASACEDVGGLCYRETGRLSLQGYAWACECSCAAFMDAEIALWDKKSKTYYMDGSPISWTVLNIIGKKANKLEGAFIVDDGAFLVGAGFGTVDTKTGNVKKISGNVAGWGEPPYCLDENCAEAYAIAYLCADEDLVPYEDLPTVFFGTFSFSHSKNDSKKMAADGNYIYGKLPDYMVF